ncbi:MAG: TIGR02391 family protein [Acidimicrobiales bacterium]|nr:TIGR02391 family protein [Acidimicrobiales bacterium]
MTFTPHTIEHLGVRMYSTLPPVLAELIAKSYDADAEQVNVKLYDKSEKRIIVEDDGHGMTFDEINNNFLRIGRNRRVNHSEKSPGGRYVTGKKGLGKLSFFGIARTIEVSTTNSGFRNTFKLDWNKIIEDGGDEDSSTKLTDYQPEMLEHDFAVTVANGTRITLSDIDRETDFDAEAVANNLAKIFIVDQDFKICTSRNDGKAFEVDNIRRLDTLETQFVWAVPDDVEGPVDYLKLNNIRGKIVSTAKPISPKTNLRGIALFSRNKLVNMPDFFSDSTSSNFYSYITGWLEVDFIDNIVPDVISTNRQSLDWRRKETQELQNKLLNLVRWLARDWRRKRDAAHVAKIKEMTNIDVKDWQSKVPPELNISLSPVIAALSNTSIDNPEQEEKLIKGLEQLKILVPEHTFFHYRRLHQTLKDVVIDAYINQDYFSAVFEGVKKYVEEVKLKSGVSLTDRDLLEKVFKNNEPVLSVTEGFQKPDGTAFEIMTLTNISEGHRGLVIAMWQAFRSPIAHQVVADLRASGLYVDIDCLDALSLLSHLFYRLEKSTKL